MRRCTTTTLLLACCTFNLAGSADALSAWTTTAFPCVGTVKDSFLHQNVAVRQNKMTRDGYNPRGRSALNAFTFPYRARESCSIAATTVGKRCRSAVTRLPCAVGGGDEVQAAEDCFSSETSSSPSVFIFGVGYVATAIALAFHRKGWAVHGTCTDPRKVKTLEEQGIKAYIFDDWSGPMMQPEPLEALASATCVLSTVPPSLQSGADPVLVAHAAELEWAYQKGDLRWIGYLSSTGVYGDRGGGWVTEDDEPWPAAPRTKARLKAERSWLRLHARNDLPVHVFRLAGIYGPGRSALDAVARHNGDIRLAGSDDGTMVSRIHAADIVGVIEASIERPDPGSIVNVADDLPSTRYETLAYGCSLMGYPRQDPDPGEKHSNRRGGGNKRVDNGKMRALLEASGRSLVFEDYRVGLRALHEGDGRPFSQPSEAAEEQPTPPTKRGSPESPTDSIESELKTLAEKMSSLESSVARVLTLLESGNSVRLAGVGSAQNTTTDAITLPSQKANVVAVDTDTANSYNSSCVNEVVVGSPHESTDGAGGNVTDLDGEYMGLNNIVTDAATTDSGNRSSSSVDVGEMVDINVAGC